MSNNNNTKRINRIYRIQYRLQKTSFCRRGFYTKFEEISISKKHRFILGFLILFNESTSFSYGVDSKIYDTNHPKELFQCREYSNNSESCCMFDGEINCILADNKFGSESEYTERISVNNH